MWQRGPGASTPPNHRTVPTACTRPPPTNSAAVHLADPYALNRLGKEHPGHREVTIYLCAPTSACPTHSPRPVASFPSVLKFPRFAAAAPIDYRK